MPAAYGAVCHRAGSYNSSGGIEVLWQHLLPQKENLRKKIDAVRSSHSVWQKGVYMRVKKVVVALATLKKD